MPTKVIIGIFKLILKKLIIFYFIFKANEEQNSSSDESNESDNEDEIESSYHSLTSIYVLNAIKKVIDKDMKPALLWLIESLDDAIDDLDVDESDIPLLPLTDECMTAVNDIDFQEAMKILGLHKPSSIQVTYCSLIIGYL